MSMSDYVNGFPEGLKEKKELSLLKIIDIMAFILQRAAIGSTSTITLQPEEAARKTVLKSHLLKPIVGFRGGKSTFATRAQDVLV